MQPKEILKQLSAYSPVMYRDIEDDSRLRTGDVVLLDIKSFEKILRNFTLLKPLLESYQKNSKYQSNFWAILNKPCDMVHEGSQRFKSSSLFLAPLQSFLGEMKKERLFSEFVLSPRTIPSVTKALISVYGDHLKKVATELFPLPDNATSSDKANLGKNKSIFREGQLTWAKANVFAGFNETESVEIVETALMAYAEKLVDDDQKYFRDFCLSLNNNVDWLEYKKEYDDQVKGVVEIRVNPETLTELTKMVFLNQMEIRGRFYYEPNINLYNKEVNDFSYIIELEDLMTMKVDERMVDSGDLVELLKNNRLVGLSRNYSDRLQNIMGHYYSKIGTPDVTAINVLGIYDKCFDFFIPYPDKPE